MMAAPGARWGRIMASANHGSTDRLDAAAADHGAGPGGKHRFPDRHERDLEFLARAATEWVELPLDEDILAFAGRRLAALVGDALVIVSEYTPATRTMHGCATFGPPEMLARWTAVDPDVVGGRVALVEPAVAALNTGRLIEVPGGIDLVSMGRIAPDRARDLEAAIDFRCGFVMGFALQGELFGGLLLIARQRTELPDPRIIEAFVNQATVALQRRRAEQGLRESERRFRELADQLPQAVLELDARGNITFVNRYIWQAAGLDGPDALLGVNVIDTHGRQDREWFAARIRQVLDGDVLHGDEITGLRPNGTPYAVAVYASRIERGGQVVGLRAVAVDVSERQRAEAARQRFEEQLQHAEKLESLAVLAGGLAHDYNNLLVAILGNAELALTGLKSGTAAHDRVSKIQKAARKAAELTNQLLDYSGRRHFALRALRLNEIVEEVRSLVGGALDRVGTVRLELQPALPDLEGDAAQVRQVVSSLLSNAADAIEGRGGTITVRTGLMRGDHPALRDAYLGGELLPEDYVYIEVADTGCGMDEATRARVFDPFFTTKFPGRGLGLAAVLGIVRGHRGAIHVASEVDRGTTFRVLFRVAAPAPADGSGGAD
jgi:PAS domain S-box-containing protein